MCDTVNRFLRILASFLSVASTLSKVSSVLNAVLMRSELSFIFRYVRTVIFKFSNMMLTL